MYPLSVIAVVVMLATQSDTICADDALKERFLAEAPPAWNEYLSSEVHLDGRIFEKKADLRKNETTTNERLIKVSGPWAVWTETEEVTRTDPAWSGTVEHAYGTNSRYAFQLFRSGVVRDWVIEKLVPHANASGTQLEVRDAAQRGTNILASALIIYPRSLATLQESPGFHLNDALRVVQDGKELVEIQFSYDAADKEDIRIHKGRAVLDPSRFWLIREGQLEMRWPSEEEGTVTSTSVYVDGIAGVPLLQSKEVLIEGRPDGSRAASLGITEPTSLKTDWEYDVRRLDDAGEEEFMLTAFGLPEPDLGKTPAPIWMWFLVGGVLLIVIAVLWRRWMPASR